MIGAAAQPDSAGAAAQPDRQPQAADARALARAWASARAWAGSHGHHGGPDGPPVGPGARALTKAGMDYHPRLGALRFRLAARWHIMPVIAHLNGLGSPGPELSAGLGGSQGPRADP